MKNTVPEKSKHLMISHFFDYIKNHNLLDGIKNETWLYLIEHEPSDSDIESQDRIMVGNDFNNYLH